MSTNKVVKTSPSELTRRSHILRINHKELSKIMTDFSGDAIDEQLVSSFFEEECTIPLKYIEPLLMALDYEIIEKDELRATRIVALSGCLKERLKGEIGHDILDRAMRKAITLGVFHEHKGTDKYMKNWEALRSILEAMLTDQ